MAVLDHAAIRDDVEAPWPIDDQASAAADGARVARDGAIVDEMLDRETFSRAAGDAARSGSAPSRRRRGSLADQRRGCRPAAAQVPELPSVPPHEHAASSARTEPCDRGAQVVRPRSGVGSRRAVFRIGGRNAGANAVARVTSTETAIPVRAATSSDRRRVSWSDRTRPRSSPARCRGVPGHERDDLRVTSAETDGDRPRFRDPVSTRMIGRPLRSSSALRKSWRAPRHFTRKVGARLSTNAPMPPSSLGVEAESARTYSTPGAWQSHSSLRRCRVGEAVAMGGSVGDWERARALRHHYRRSTALTMQLHACLRQRAAGRISRQPSPSATRGRTYVTPHQEEAALPNAGRTSRCRREAVCSRARG